MSLIYRLEKGAPLTLTELDGNFRFIEETLRTHEHQIATLKGISHIRYEDGALVFQNDGEEALCRVPVPVPSFHHQGQWQPGHDYTYGNITAKAGESYICLSAHTSGEWAEDGQMWLSLTGGNSAKISSLTPDDDEAPGIAGAAAARSPGAGQGAANVDGIHLPRVPVVPADRLPVPHVGRLVVVAIDAEPGFALALGVSGGWMNITTGKML